MYQIQKLSKDKTLQLDASIFKYCDGTKAENLSQVGIHQCLSTEQGTKVWTLFKLRIKLMIKMKSQTKPKQRHSGWEHSESLGFSH